jgi:hypothetical protein
MEAALNLHQLHSFNIESSWFTITGKNLKLNYLLYNII